ncbi:MAG: putative distal tail protein [Prokaryotic dsDNA virus sp.]|nr:MAG: putative distal tail protein [Prokaryotic dsDNA virus sp.]|tara:strand:- start:1318 stop:1923 length:606 start_codon:yes stop_codon:yes gene_type:complete
MSGAFPTSPAFRTLNFKDNRPVLVNQTLSGKKSSRLIGSQYFSFQVSMPPMTQEESQSIFAFLQKQKGGFENFTIQHPTDNLGSNRTQTDILVNGAHSSGDASIVLDGFDASTSGVLKAGDLIKFANHSKVYMVQSDIDSNGSGECTVLISPALVSSLANNEAVTVNKPSFTVYLSSNEIMYTTSANGLYSISFEVREVIT